MTIRRDWSIANLKREAGYGRCVVCGKPNAELAHLVGRGCDANPPLRWTFDKPWKPYLVVPDRVILLCGPATTSSTCHGRQHNGDLDILGYTDLHEQAQAVVDAGGMYPALWRLVASENPRRVAA